MVDINELAAAAGVTGPVASTQQWAAGSSDESVGSVFTDLFTGQGLQDLGHAAGMAAPFFAKRAAANSCCVRITRWSTRSCRATPTWRRS